jgi:lipopolysaccharide export system ATP-binding protein|uniref:LPS export ABC transporter ATP-binding protein n=1 Tax=Desulfobacca acetoxidans TaxID=60893 RepID=A0A7V6A1H3_9BACT
MTHHLILDHLSKSYDGRKVVDNVTLEVKSGEVVGLLGPNGAGKTTTFFMVLGLLRPDLGAIILDGEDISQLPIYQRARKGLQYLPQESSVFRKLTVAENIMAILETLEPDARIREERLNKLLGDLRISHLANQKAASLSGGERRRVEITRALVTSPRFIILDEPFAGIDPLAVTDIQNIIRQLKDRGLGVLISDHNVRETLWVCDRAYLLNEGVVLEEGTPEHVVNSELAKRIYLGESFTL